MNGPPVELEKLEKLEAKQGIHVNKETVVTLQRIGEVKALEVLETDLDQIGESVAGESQALGFLTFSAGSWLSALLQWVSVEEPTTIARVIFGVTVGVGVLGTFWFGIEYWRRWSRRTTLLKRLKNKAG